MLEYASVADRARKAHSSVAKLQALIAREPENRAAQINLKAMLKFAGQADEQLSVLAAKNWVEVCKYRMVPMNSEGYGLGQVSRALLSYQNLFSQIYDSFRNGPKSKATVGRDAMDESSLEFAYTYAGSLGVVLLSQSERDFLGGNLDSSIDALYQIIEISDQDAVRDIASQRGRAVVKRVYDWSTALSEGGFSADIQWQRSDGKHLGEMVDRSRLEKIANFITEAADAKTEDIEIEGILVGANRQTKAFQISEQDGETYKGRFDQEFLVPSEMTVGGLYRATVRIEDQYFYASDTHKKTQSLLRLEGPLLLQNKV